MEILVFKTSVQNHDSVNQLAPLLNGLAGCGKWSFALDDCDRILRIVSASVQPQQAIQLLAFQGFMCEELT